MKTDDDTWVRLPKVLAALHYPPLATPARAAAAATREGLAAMSQKRGEPMATDGMMLYNTESLAQPKSLPHGSNENRKKEARGR